VELHISRDVPAARLYNVGVDRQIILFAHNIRSLWNVGSLFRTCDAFGVERLILSGYTATPPRREISKTALGAEETVPWEKIEDTQSTLRDLKDEGYTIVALEQTENAQELKDYEPPERLCLIIGHEVTGVPQELLKCCGETVEIPMLGGKESLNVAVAAGIALHNMRNT